MTREEIIARIERFKEILEQDPYLGKRFNSFRAKKAARNQSRYRRINAGIEYVHLKQLLSRKEAAEIFVHAPSEDDEAALIEALTNLQVDFQHTQTFRERLALLTDALEEARV